MSSLLIQAVLAAAETGINRVLRPTGQRCRACAGFPPRSSRSTA